MKMLFARFLTYSIWNSEFYYAQSLGAMVIGMSLFVFGEVNLDVTCLIAGFTLMGTGVVLLACGEVFRKIGDYLYEKYEEEMKGEEDE